MPGKFQFEGRNNTLAEHLYTEGNKYDKSNQDIIKIKDLLREYTNSVQEVPHNQSLFESILLRQITELLTKESKKTPILERVSTIIAAYKDQPRHEEEMRPVIDPDNAAQAVSLVSDHTEKLHDKIQEHIV